MGQGSAQTVKEIEDVRGRLERNLRELQDRLPQPAVWMKRLVGVAVGGGVAGSVFWFAVRRARRRREEPDAVRAVVKLLPTDGMAAGTGEDDQRWAQWLAAGAGVWLALRLMELRQGRKRNKLLAARPA